MLLPCLRSARIRVRVAAISVRLEPRGGTSARATAALARHDLPRPAQDFALALRSDLLGSARLARLPGCDIAIFHLPFTIADTHARANPMALICRRIPASNSSNLSREVRASAPGARRLPPCTVLAPNVIPISIRRAHRRGAPACGRISEEAEAARKLQGRRTRSGTRPRGGDRLGPVPLGASRRVGLVWLAPPCAAACAETKSTDEDWRGWWWCSEME